MNPLEFKGPRARVSNLREHFGLTAQDIAEATASDPRSVRRWATQSEDRRSRVDDHIRHLEQVTAVLSEIGVAPASVRFWLREPNSYLHRRTPLAELGAGCGAAVVDAARALAEGAIGANGPRLSGPVEPPLAGATAEDLTVPAPDGRTVNRT